MDAEPLVRVRAGVAAAVLFASASGGATSPPDANRGATLHYACLSCHSTEVYSPTSRKVTSLKALRREVERWNRTYNPKFSRSDIEDLVAYLNRDFYRFE